MLLLMEIKMQITSKCISSPGSQGLLTDVCHQTDR
jgi:hypothetical protein